MGLQYSCLYWTNHMIKAKECNEMKDCVLNFITSKKAIYWMECLIVMGEIGAITSGVKNIKDWGDVNNIPSISKVTKDIQRFVDSFSAVIIENTLGGHKDQVASVAYSPDEPGHMTSGSSDHTVRIWGAQTGEQVGQPLQGQNEGIVKLLVDAGADVNAQGGFYANALQAAVYGKNEEIVKLLVDAGADVNVQGGKYGNALQAAAAGTGSEAIVKILLGAGADVNAQGGQYGNALQAAASAGNETMMQLLLEAGADIEPEPRTYSIELFPLDGQDESETMPPEPLFYSIEVLPLDDSTDEADTEPPEAFTVELNTLERSGDGDF
ncbi:ankyrin [Dendrothele bispora CBS 962.96]|uniref:Ankyrin n=1 Tax=Dendrothele bispora (strain CBS 962.96) TaxID=1314807 RepID=A0A4S8LZ55_DENBC|nr:ankyrin [Dendrothele bispora CBS 962.96]